MEDYVICPVYTKGDLVLLGGSIGKVFTSVCLQAFCLRAS